MGDVPKQPLELDHPTRRRLARKADVDPRTLARVARGGPVQRRAARRAARVLRAAGFLVGGPHL
jgi:hypothetical protein